MENRRPDEQSAGTNQTDRIDHGSALRTQTRLAARAISRGETQNIRCENEIITSLLRVVVKSMDDRVQRLRSNITEI